MKAYAVLTGIVRFEQAASSPGDAIALLQSRIRARANQRKNPDIGMSLVTALAAGRLNFLVLDEHGNPVAGELQGQYQEPPELQLVLQFKAMISPEALYTYRKRYC